MPARSAPGAEGPGEAQPACGGGLPGLGAEGLTAGHIQRVSTYQGSEHIPGLMSRFVSIGGIVRGWSGRLHWGRAAVDGSVGLR